MSTCYLCGKAIPGGQTREWQRLPSGEIDWRDKHITCTPRPRLTSWERFAREIKRLLPISIVITRRK